MNKIKAYISGLTLGSRDEVIVQTMCNTATTDIESSFKQAKILAQAGAQMIRLTTQGPKEVDALAVIKQRLRDEGITTPLVADVHFSHTVAKKAATVADKVRINPGNFSVSSKVPFSHFKEFLEICDKYNCAVRIGVNHGSLGEENTLKYGNTPLGMANVAMEWLRVAVDSNFHNVVLSLKASNVLVMTQAYQLLYNQMLSFGAIYPLHLGVTEAGNDVEGRIKSALGLSALLKRGIGDTIRVSLTENPINEIPVAKEIVRYCKEREGEWNNLPDFYECSNFQEFIIRATCDYGSLLLEREISNFSIGASINGKMVGIRELESFKDSLLQAARLKFTKPEYIACPGCGRTQYNLEAIFKEVKERTSHLKGYNIAVMGCIVNGPGEMADADYGYVGQGGGKVAIYRGKEMVYSNIKQEEAIDLLLNLIDEDARNKIFLPRI